MMSVEWPLMNVYDPSMELEAFPLYSVMQWLSNSNSNSNSNNSNISVGTLVCFSLMILIVTLIGLSPRWATLFCNCQTCEAYLTASWSKSFDNLCDWYTHLLRNSPTKTIHIHVLRNTITANPDNVEHMLKTRFHNFPKGKPFSAILGDFLGRGIFNVDGESWSFQKNMATLELTKHSVRSFAFEVVRFEIHHRLVPLLLKKEKDGAVLDLQDVFKRFSFDSICRFSFGLDPMCLELSLPMSEFALAFDVASKVSAERAMAVSPLVWKTKRLLNLGSEKKLREAVRMIDVLAKEVIRQKRKMGFSSHKDLLSRFMSSVNDETYLKDIIVSFLLAGRDTVASALTSFFWLVAKHPRVESAILLEAERVIGDRNKEITSFEEIQRLQYLQAAAYESMRLYPPVQFDSKFCLEDDVLADGTFVKRGSRVSYHVYAMGRLEEIWGCDWCEFRPERWLKEGVFCPQSPFKYPVFQAGMRVCLGKEMALMELKSVAISLLRRFHFQLFLQHPPPSNPRFSPGLTATFSSGLPVMLRQRPTNQTTPTSIVTIK